MYYFIINPKSRSGLGLKLWQETERSLRRQHIAYQAFLTQYRGHAKTIARRLSEVLTKQDVLSAIGGDGTVNEIINGLSDPARVTFGYIPTGSGNDFARGMKLPSRPEAALQAILHPKTIHPLDICCCRTEGKERYFAISSGIGFDAGICHEALSSRIKTVLNHLRLGKLTYALIALRQLFFFRRFNLELVLDDGGTLSFEKVWFLTAMNQRCEGGGFRFCPQADNSDGMLDLMVVSHMSRLAVLCFLPAAFFGKHTKLRGIRLLRCRSLRIRTDLRRPVHLDGESGGTLNDFEIFCTGRQLNVIVE